MDEERQQETHIKVVTVEAVPLNPFKKYLILLDGHAVTREEAREMGKQLRAMGITHYVGLIVDGDPATSVQLVEI